MLGFSLICYFPVIFILLEIVYVVYGGNDGEEIDIESEICEWWIVGSNFFGTLEKMNQEKIGFFESLIVFLKYGTLREDKPKEKLEKTWGVRYAIGFTDFVFW